MILNRASAFGIGILLIPVLIMIGILCMILAFIVPIACLIKPSIIDIKK